MAHVHDVSRLLPRHYKIIDMYLSGKYTHQQIADSLDMDRKSVTAIISMPSMQDEIAKRRVIQNSQVDEVLVIDRINQVDTARSLLEEASINAAGTLIDCLLSGDEKMKNKSANDILDRVGISRVQKNENVNKTSVLFIDAETAARVHKTFELDSDEHVA